MPLKIDALRVGPKHDNRTTTGVYKGLPHKKPKAGAYYNKAKNTIKVRKYRQHKRELLKQNKIKST